jgi:hypothetical protein
MQKPPFKSASERVKALYKPNNPVENIKSATKYLTELRCPQPANLADNPEISSKLGKVPKPNANINKAPDPGSPDKNAKGNTL